MKGRKPTAKEPVSGAQLREAERGFLAMLRSKGFPLAWVERNSLDLLAQASSEYAAWMGDHEPEENPVGWLITCAYRRAVNQLKAEGRRPPAEQDVSALADSSTPTPEQEVLDDERQSRLRSAISCLPEKEQRLISLHYFEGHSLPEAGRRVGWRKSAAHRHHQAALERLRVLVGDDPSLLSPASLGFGAWVAVAADRGGNLARRLGDGVRRLVPILEPGGPLAGAGAGRALGACGAGLAAAICGLAVAGVHPALPGLGSTPAPPPPHRRVVAPRAERPADRVVVGAPVPAPEGEASSSASPSKAPPQRHARSVAARRASRPATRPEPAPSPEPVTEEFGIEGTSAELPEEQATSPAAKPAPSSSAPAPAREATGARVKEEFGL
ncbi:MAG TPA: sigma-70 family RNA polymerase sigma factor [Solirubrobacterales bacterium]|nr:sigma-70 family RNA polymerase sigma factor [Solirubrobacterales bacterium]